MDSRFLARAFLSPAVAIALGSPVWAEPPTPLEAWFATPPAERQEPQFKEDLLSKSGAEKASDEVIAACKAGAKTLGWDKTLPPIPPSLEEMKKNPPKEPLRPGALHVGTFTMPFVLLVKGEKPKDGWPLLIALHGGGGNDKATGPHEWEVNTNEWRAQMALFERVYEPAGIYFIPRMADDRKGRWYLDHNQQAFEEVIRSAILFRDIDPNRVYLLGISEGGYGAIRFAGNRPDRFAATNGMAAAEPIETSPPENMRNVGMRIDIGEKDTMFDRVGLARRMGAKLEELKKADPGGYDFLVNIQPGRGHGIDYAAGPKWIAERIRNPLPERVVWTVKPFDKTVALQRYWLALKAAPGKMPLYITASIKDNTVTLTAETDGPDKQTRIPAAEGTLLVRLTDKLADLDKPVQIRLNGKLLPPVTVERRLSTMARTMAERCDPNYLFPAEIAVPLSAE